MSALYRAAGPAGTGFCRVAREVRRGGRSGSGAAPHDCASAAPALPRIGRGVIVAPWPLGSCAGAMICELLFDARQRILLIRMGRVLSPEALGFMQAALARFLAAHGRTSGILDLSATEEVAVPVADLVVLAKHRPVMAGTRRIFVAASVVTYG